MTTDINTHLGHWPFRRLRHNTAEGLVELMDRNWISRACVSMFECVFYKDVQVGNRELCEQLKGCTDRLLPVGVINPAFPGWARDYEECFAELGMRGVRVYPNYHGYGLADDCARELFSLCDRDGRAVWLTVRLADERMHHWLVKVPPVPLDVLGDLAGSFPRVRFVVVNAVLAELLRVKEAFREHDNVFCDISHVDGVNCVRRLADEIGPERVLFGTHAPYLYAESAVLKMKESELAEEERELMSEGNAARVLGEGGAE